MTWEELGQLDDAQLNTAIDTHVYGYAWEDVSCEGLDGWWGSWWRCQERPGGRTTYSSSPCYPHTADWGRTMAVAWRCQVALRPHWVDGGHPVFDGWDAELRWASRRAHLNKGWPYVIHCATEADARVALCRLALWAALHPQAVPA